MGILFGVESVIKMKCKFFVVFSLLLAFVSVSAQDIHVVGKGETVSSIAGRYGLSESALIEANPLLQNGCFVGMKLTVPKRVDPAQEKRWEELTLGFTLWDNADNEFEDGHYNKARKIYSEALSYLDDAELYFNRALCYYNLSKYKKALRDLDSCDDRNPGSDLKERTRSLRRTIYEKQGERKELWGEVALAAAGTALVVGGAIAASSMSSNSGSYSPAYTVPSYNSSYDAIDSYTQQQILSDKMQIQQMSAMRVSMAQQEQIRLEREFEQIQKEFKEDLDWKMDVNNPVNKVFYQQFLEEYRKNPMEFINPEAMFASMFREETGRGPNLREINLFNDIFSIYLASLSPSTNYVTTIDDSPDVQERHNDAIDRIHGYYDDHYGDVKCQLCQIPGNGICKTCGGRGYRDLGLGLGKTEECPNCYVENGRRTGKCSKCKGTGKVYGIKH